MSSNKLFAALPLAAICVFMPHHSPAQEQQQGMVVVRDAQTGQLRAPTPAEARALAPKATGAMAAQGKPSMVTHASGARQVHLGERGLVYSVVTRDAEGKLADQCMHGADAADKAVHQHGQGSSHAGHDKEGRHESK
jgi:hypothetical protein